MNTLSITALEEGIGKTAITLALAEIARSNGSTIGYMKPKGTRLESHVGKVIDSDPLFAREQLGLDAELEDLEPIVYSPTFIENAVRGQEDAATLRERVQGVFAELARDRDVMFVEGAGRIDMGAIIELTDRDIAELLGARVVLVAGYERFGDLDRVIHSASTFGDAFAGVLFNRVRDHGVDQLTRDGIPFLERRGYPVLGVIPHDRELAGVTVSDLANELGAQALTTAGSDAIVERFLVGAMSGETALRHFRRSRNTAVVTGGDRADIHAAAIEASGVTCLVVTGGLRPSAQILREAAEADLTVLALDADTLSAVERAEQIVRSGRTRDAETVRRIVRYMREHVDVDRVFGT